MSIPTVEVFSAAAAATYRENPHDNALVQPGFDPLVNTKGLLKPYHGLQHEDKSTIYFLFVWESIQDHKNLINDAPAHKIVVDGLALLVDNTSPTPHVLYHVTPSSEPYKAFEAPVVEMATFTLHDGQSKSALEALVNEITIAMNAQGEADGVVHATFGQVIEHDNMLMLFIGWTSVEAHFDLVNNNPKFVDIIKRIREVATIQLVHVPLSTYQPAGSNL